MKAIVNKAFWAVVLGGIFNLSAAQQSNEITFSEIMFFPSETNAEFIELFNLSLTDTIDLSGYGIKYHTSAPDYFDSTDTGYFIPPQGYAIILEKDYDDVSGVYNGLIPASAQIIKLNNNSFGSSGMSNSSDRKIYLIDDSSVAVDSVIYSADNRKGYSDEKIFMTNDNTSYNWANSSSLNGTPGFRNSVSPLEYDISLDSVMVLPVSPFAQSDFTASIFLSNKGLNSVDSVYLKIFDDVNGDSVISEPPVAVYFIDSIPIGNKVETPAQLNLFNNGMHSLYALVEAKTDENPLNDTLLFNVYIRPKPNKTGDVLINEFMYLPEGDEPEWIELFNTAADTINLRNWKFKDKTSHTLLSAEKLLIPPGEFLVISEDSLSPFYSNAGNVHIKNIPSLNNSGDEITLVDSLNRSIDSVAYSSGWGNEKGRSLERIDYYSGSCDSLNWKNSVAAEGATPGRYNSVSTYEYDLQLNSFILDAPYAVLNQPLYAEFEIYNRGTTDAENFSLNIFYDFNNNNTGDDSELIWSETFAVLRKGERMKSTVQLNALPLGSGNLIVNIDFPQDQFTDNNVINRLVNVVEINVYRGDIILNEIMYAPNSPEPEWIELYNNTESPIDFSKYLIADAKDTAAVDTQNILISAHSYAIIAKDTSFNSVDNLSGTIAFCNFPSLGNGGDLIVLMDSLGRTLDSVKYHSDWGGSHGRSLERISEFVSSTDSANWAESTDSSGATPLKINSVSQKLFDAAIDSVIVTPQIPLRGSNVDLTVIVSNSGRRTVQCVLKIFEKENYDSSNYTMLFESEIFSIDSGETISVTAKKVIRTINETKNIFTAAETPGDQNIANNTYTVTVMPSYLSNDIVINEFMGYPSGGEPEWIELKNVSVDTVNLFGWKLSDVITTPKESIVSDTGFFLLPNELLVIAKDSSIWDFHRTIPSKVIVSDFANLNNDEDGIVLRDANGITIDSLFYSTDWNVTKGYSLEKIDLGVSGLLANNWGVSTDVEQSTPGRINSLALKRTDVVISSVQTEPKFPAPYDSVRIKTILVNNGYEPIDDVKLKIFLQSKDVLWEESGSFSIEAYDSVEIVSVRKTEIIDSLQVFVDAESVWDDNPFNNYFGIVLYSGLTAKALKINELMISPEKGGAEWIELINDSKEPINIKGLKIIDYYPSEKTTVITQEEKRIPAGGYLIIANDSLSFVDGEFIVPFGSLNSYEDAIAISDFRSAPVDSFGYNRSFTIVNGRSLERFDLDVDVNDKGNWYPSVDSAGHTCAAVNSIISIQPLAKSMLIFNEIMYEPAADYAEYIEFFNNTDSPLNLEGINLLKSDSVFIELIPFNLALKPKSFYLLANDSSIYEQYPYLKSNGNVTVSKFALSNSGEPLILSDFFGTTIDSLYYSPDWHNAFLVQTKGKSLERINYKHFTNEKDNWGTSTDPAGGTPLKINSVYTASPNSVNSLSFSNNPFSPDGDGYQDFTIISYKLKSNAALVRIKIFDDKGRLVRTLTENRLSGSNGEIIFDGKRDDGRPLRVGMYIVFLEGISESGGGVESVKKILVVATKL